jgi:hypothetical protein
VRRQILRTFAQLQSYRSEVYMVDKMTDRRNASRARQRLLDAARAVLARSEEIVTERGPLLKAAFQLRGTRCGKDNCKCNDGDLHTTAVLVVSEEGKRRSYYVRGPERPDVKRRVEKYQHFRATRIELNKLMAELLSAVDDLLDALAEPHVPRRDAKGSGRKRRPQRGRRKT